MPVTFDNSNSTSTNGTALSLALTAASNAVLVAFTFNDNAQSCSSVAYNGVALTRLCRVSPGDVEIWGLTAPAAGANNLVVQLAGAATGFGVVACTYTNAKSTNTFGTAVSGTATTANPNLSLSSTTTDIVIGAFKVGFGTCEIKNGTTRGSVTAAGVNNARMVVADIAGAPSVTLSASMSSSQNMQMGGVTIQFSAAATSSFVGFRSLMGVGI
jgi:hypothetical protein